MSHLLLYSSTARFKIHAVPEVDANGKAHQVVILENKSGSVVAINKDNDTVIAKVRLQKIAC